MPKTDPAFFLIYPAGLTGIKRKSENMIPSVYDGAISQMSTTSSSSSSSTKISNRRESGQPTPKRYNFKTKIQKVQ